MRCWRSRRNSVRTARLSIAGALACALVLAAQPRAPIAYTVRVPDPASHFVSVEAAVPTDGRATIDMMMPIWSPGYYRIERYADHVDGVTARADGDELPVERPQPNRWRVAAAGHRAVTISYRVFCNQRSVTTNYVDADYAVLNGAPTFMTPAGDLALEHDVRLELPPQWMRAMSGLESLGDGDPNHFRAADYETLVDSPILAGQLEVHEFEAGGVPHDVVAAGDVDGWDGDAAARDLRRYVEEVRRFWGFLPYAKYDFLLVFRRGGGGLEHKNSTLSTVAVRAGTPWPGIGLLSHEYFHLFNVKRLRPAELGPFDFEHPPATRSLWIAEGLTSYYSDLLMERSGLRSRTDYLASLSKGIADLQQSPGRLLQSVEQSSLDVWNNSNSGVNPNAATVSYYGKGEVLGLLLDAKIRRVTNGRRSLDDVMRLAYRRYSGARGYTPDEFRGVAEEIAGVDLRDWFRLSVSSAGELDYRDLLEAYGLRFVGGGLGAWTLEAVSSPTATQRRNMDRWLTGS